MARRPALFFSLALPLLIALALGAPAAAEVLSLSPADLESSWDPFREDTDFVPANGYRTPFAFGACTHAPVQLPDGATISSLVALARDDNANADVEVRLLRAGNAGAAGQQVITVASSGSSSSIRTFLGLPAGGTDTVVDKATEMWWLVACYDADGADIELHHVYLNYTGRAAGVDTRDPLVIPAAAFRVTGELGSADAKGFDEAHGFAHTSFSQDGCWYAPVILPGDASIQSLSAQVWDDSDANFSIQLRRKRLHTSETSQLLAELVTSGKSATVRHFQTQAIANARVDGSYHYYLSTAGGCLEQGTTMRLYTVRIGHDDAIFVDGFASGNASRWNGAPAADLVLSPTAFGMATTDTDGAVLSTSGVVTLEECAAAPVTLPNGAEIYFLTSYLRDADPSRNLTLQLWRKRGLTGTATELAALTTSGSSANPQVDALAVSEVIDSDTYHYYVSACLPSGGNEADFSVHGARVSYFLP